MNDPTAPQPLPPEPTAAPRRSWPRKHKIATALLAAVALIVVIIAVTLATAKPKPASPAATTAPTSASTPSPTPPLGTGQAAFVAAVRSALATSGASNPATDAQIAKIGGNVCNARFAGASQASVISGAQKGETERAFSMTPGTVVTTAENDICPSQLPPPAPPAPVTLISQSGSDDYNSPPFTVNSGTVTATYSYSNCAGGSGNFIADMQTPNQSSLNSDDQSIANAIGSGASTTTTLYPTEVGQQYYLSVTSECNWTVTLTENG